MKRYNSHFRIPTRTEDERVKTLLVIAGSDSSGGAGIQADCAAARSLGVYPINAVSCITNQGVEGLYDLQICDYTFFQKQLFILFEEFLPDAVKIGMLPTDRHIEILIKALSEFRPANVVLDPILSATLSKINFTDKLWVNKTLLNEIAPYVELITPNLPEGRILTKDSPARKNHLNQAASIGRAMIEDSGFKAVLIKGGHEDSGTVICDILVKKGEENSITFFHPKINTINTHGTGCALSSLIASHLALGVSLEESIKASIKALSESLERNSHRDFFPNPDAHGPAFF